MSSAAYFFYALVLSPLAWLILQVGGFFGDAKWKTFLRAKNGRVFHFNGMSEAELQAKSPLWVHAASGEIEYARPVLREWKKRHPEIPLIVTYMSPSAIRILENLSEVDAWGPAPWEFAGDVQEFLRRFQPRALLVARTDLWPVMTTECRRAGVPMLLFSATFATGSSRLKGLARFITERSLRQLSGLHLVARDDAANLSGLFTDLPLEVAGDTRFDQVLHRLENASALPADLAPTSQPVLVAGSTWPEDEAVLLPAVARLTSYNLILAPHDLRGDRLNEIEKKLKELGLSSQRFSAGGPWKSRVLLVDRIGILAELYAWGDVAFVGGSFRKQVHSVMEPMAAGLRVLVGPFHVNNREALSFQKEIVAGTPIVRVIHNMDEVLEALRAAETTKARDEIRRVVASKRGATAKVIQWCEDNALSKNRIPRTPNQL